MADRFKVIPIELYTEFEKYLKTIGKGIETNVVPEPKVTEILSKRDTEKPYNFNERFKRWITIEEFLTKS